MKNKSCIIIIVLFVITVAFGVLLLLTRKKEETATDVGTQEEQLESIFTILPYETESFSIYYFEEDKKYYVAIRDIDYERALEDALFILHKYEETKNFTEEDIVVVNTAPSFMNDLQEEE
jgi:flagellar basal body-associated protein FliL